MANFKNGIEIYYVFRCDDKRKVEGVASDEYFDLDAVGERDYYKCLLDKNQLNYDYLLEVFSTETYNIIDNYYIVSNNHLNN